MRTVSLAAIYAVALQSILFGIAPVANFDSSSVDPFMVICRSDGQASSAQTGGKEDHKPGQDCERCTLCSTANPPLTPRIFSGREAFVTNAFAIYLIARPPGGFVSDHKLARGPPRSS